MTVLRVVIAFVVALILVAVAVANREPVVLDLVLTEINAPLAAALLIAWTFGAFSYALFALVGEIRLRARLTRLRREIEALSRELNDLRNLPLTEEPPENLPPVDSSAVKPDEEQLS